MSDDMKTRMLSTDDPAIQEAFERYSVKPLGTGTLGGKTELLILIGDEVLRFSLGEQTSWVLGRFETVESSHQVDLTPYGAQGLGVSRLHAQLHVEDDKLFITDLNSSNGTYVQDTRLTPNMATHIHSGTVVLLGLFALQVMFR